MDNMVAVLIYERWNAETYCCEPLEISLILETCNLYVNNKSKGLSMPKKNNQGNQYRTSKVADVCVVQ